MALVWFRLCSFDRRGLSQCWRADCQGRWSGLASVPLVEWAQSLWWRADRKSALVWSSLCSFGRLGLSHCGGGPIGKGVVLVSRLFHWYAWAQPLWWLADRQGRWFWSRLCSFGRRGLSLWWRAYRQGR
jgi:hypothetical protein